MAASALLITDRPQFEALWRPVCEQHGLVATARHPSSFDEVEPGRAIVFDAAPATYDEDELLAHVGHARARGAVVAVSIDAEPLESVDDLLEELCPGLVARTPNDANRVASLLARPLALRHARRLARRFLDGQVDRKGSSVLLRVATPFTHESSPTGAGCTFFEAMLKELLRLLVGHEGVVEHVRCAERGEGRCEWRAEWRKARA